jgi:hypothetical protein
MQDFDLTNKNGDMFLEARSDGGIGIFVAVSKDAKSAAMALTKEEMIKMAGWLITYIDSTNTVGKSAISDDLDKAITDELNHKPKDIMG